MNINIKKAIAATAVIAATVVGATGCANHNDDNGKANGKPSQTSTERSQKDTSTPAPQRTTPAPSQSGADNNSNSNDNGAKTNNDGTTFTQTLTADEARALDEQGLRGGVIGRENGLTVTRDGNTLTFIVDKDATSSTGTVVTASDAKKAEADAKKADADKATAETPGNNGDGILNPLNGGLTPPNGDGGTVVVPIVTPGGGDANPGNGTPGNNNPGVVAPFIPGPALTPTPTPIPGGNNQDPAPTPAPEPSHADEANSFMQTFRAKYLGLINKARADLGLKPLVPSEQLTNSAQTWASYSAEEGIADANYRDWKAGENHGSDLDGVTQYKNEAVSDTTATGGGYIGDDNNTADAIANRVFNQAINQDPEKRQVLLDANVDRVGIGVAEEIVTSRLDADGNVVRTGRKDQAIKTVVQTGSSTNASQVGPDDKVTEYKSDGTQTMNSAKNDEFDNSLPKVKGKAPETPAPAETLASNAAPSATDTTTPSEVAPVPAPAEAAGPSTEAAPVTDVAPEAGLATAAVDEAPAPESNLAPAEVETTVASAPVETPVTQVEPVHAESAAPVSQAAPVEASVVESAAPVVQAAPVTEQHAPVAASTNNDTVATQAVAATPDSGVVLGVGE